MNRTGPSIARGSSRQDWPTPRSFIDVVERRFGPVTFDLAASAANAKAARFFTAEQDALNQSWTGLVAAGENLWLNPPYDHIAPWAAKCARENQRVLFLVPASVGSNWFRGHVWGHAQVYFLNGRITFEGAEDQYPKDLMLCHYGNAMVGAEAAVWRWMPDDCV